MASWSSCGLLHLLHVGFFKEVAPFGLRFKEVLEVHEVQQLNETSMVLLLSLH